MSVLKRLFGSRPSAPPPYEAFVAHIVEAQDQPAEYRLPVSEAPALRQAIWGGLVARGLKEHQILAVLHGRLAGACPTCRMRLSLEYLEWLCTASPSAASGRAARELARFAEGRCVNAECSGTEIVIQWLP